MFRRVLSLEKGGIPLEQVVRASGETSSCGVKRVNLLPAGFPFCGGTATRASLTGTAGIIATTVLCFGSFNEMWGPLTGNQVMILCEGGNVPCVGA